MTFKKLLEIEKTFSEKEYKEILEKNRELQEKNKNLEAENRQLKNILKKGKKNE